MKALIRSMLVAAVALVVAMPAQLAAQGGQVTSVTLQPSAGKAELVVGVQGASEIRDFVLRGPDRLVLDISGATLATPAVTYDGVNRAGVRDLRYGQFQAGVVRVVLELDALMDYEVVREQGSVKVSFDAPRTFLSWSSMTPAALPLAQRPVDSPVRAVAVAQVPEELPAPPVQVPTMAQPVSQQSQEPRITVSWDRANIADVVAGFAAFSGRNIVLGKDITGEVSAEIKNQP